MKNTTLQFVKLSISLLLLIILNSGFAQVRISTNVLDFGEVETGKISTKTIKVYNDYSRYITIYPATHGMYFSHKTESHSDQVGISPNDSTTIEINYFPKHNVSNSAVFAIESNADHLCLLLNLKGTGKYPGSYYSSTQNLEEEALKDELKRIISKNYTNLGYTGARDKMYGEIDNVGGKVTCVYTGRQATFNSRSGANNNSFNCEHTWPQSKFSSREPEKADIHHLFPTDVNSNSRRGSYPFGNVSSSTWSEGGSKLGGAKFEPRDDHKGDVARSMFYFKIRYQDHGSFLGSQEKDLRKWYMEDMPSSKEMSRNEAIFKYQKNRNPFVDHPEFLERIHSITNNSVKPDTNKLCLVAGQEGIVNPKEEIRNGRTYVDQVFVIQNCGNTTRKNISVEFKNNYVSSNSSHSMLKQGQGFIIETTADLTDDKAFNDMMYILENGTKVDSIDIWYGVSSVKNQKTELTKILFNNNTNTLRIEQIPTPNSFLEIINSAGQTLERLPINESNFEHQLNSLPSGVYYLNLNSQSLNLVKKIFIL